MNIDPIEQFLAGPTPDTWIAEASKPDNLQQLLVDHANCELKAAQQAQALIWKYAATAGPNLLNKMSRLAREELRHFEQVIAIMKNRDIAFMTLSSARYAGGMRKGMRTSEPERLIDSLIIGAFIEARSCERFYRLAPRLDDELKDFYQSLLKSESRHFQDYLTLAERCSEQGADISARVEFYRHLEWSLIAEPDAEFRFHSGVPQ